MAERLTVEEASAAYEPAMRNIPAPGPGLCAICRTFVDPGYERCIPCSRQPSDLDVVVPITYSERLGQVHTALRGYKDDPPQAQRYAMVRLAAILWRFLEGHESCVAAAAGTDSFDLVTSVPSSSPEADERRPNLRALIGWCEPVNERLRRVLRATGEGRPGRVYDEGRYEATEALDSPSVLLIDDTWTTGAHAQSAAHALRAAGAGPIALVVIGRHVRPEWTVGDETCGDRLAALPRQFDWSICAVEQRPTGRS